MAAHKRRKLSHGRPPAAVSQQHASMSSQRSRRVIHAHHRLQKACAAAVKAGDTATAEAIAREMHEAHGGLAAYQAASLRGQSAGRGGDTSRVLVDWLRDAGVLPSRRKQSTPGAPYRVLEVGALSAHNCVSRHPGALAVTRIDLRAAAPGIARQDLMARPLPAAPADGFDVVSLSLVLNYVADAAARGAMLRRVCCFLRPPRRDDGDRHKHGRGRGDDGGAAGGDERDASPLLPALFLVLPLACVTNSRYLDEAALLRLLAALGFALRRKKLSRKLCFYLFHWRGSRAGEQETVPKRLVRDRPGMNNFAIALA